jgi:hypothetical protein
VKKILAAVTAVVLTGCVSIPQQPLGWRSGDVAVSANRQGCEIGNIEVTNHGSRPVKSSGVIDILDASSNTISTVSFYCENAYPGGTSSCQRFQKYDDKRLYAMPGLYCAGYSQYKMSLRSF